MVIRVPEKKTDPNENLQHQQEEQQEKDQQYESSLSKTTKSTGDVIYGTSNSKTYQEKKKQQQQHEYKRQPKSQLEVVQIQQQQQQQQRIPKPFYKLVIVGFIFIILQTRIMAIPTFHSIFGTINYNSSLAESIDQPQVIQTTTLMSTPPYSSSSSSSSSLLPLCTMDEIKFGIWKPIRLPKPPYIPTYLQWREECYDLNSLLNATHWDMYHWEPDAVTQNTCHFPQFTMEEFCHVTFNQTIVFVGDSLTLEHVNVLAHLLGFVGNMDTVWDKEHANTNFVFKVCKDDATTLIYRRSFYLEVMQDVLDKVDPDILILNRGNWYQGDIQFVNTLNRRIPAIEEWQNKKCPPPPPTQEDDNENNNNNNKKEETNRDNCQLIWRTSVPGNPLCTEYKEPVTSIEEMESVIANLSLYSGMGREKFHWWDFQHQNELAIHNLEKSQSLQFDVLPAYEMSILRPDDHTARNVSGTIDCLHNCALGGTIINYNRVLLQLIKLHRQKEKQ